MCGNYRKIKILHFKNSPDLHTNYLIKTLAALSMFLRANMAFVMTSLDQS